MYPVMLDLWDQRCLVVGGGGLAVRRVEGLLGEGARVTVLADDPVEALRRLASEGAIALAERDYREGEAAEYALVFAASESRGVNEVVHRDARASGVWVNVADDHELGNVQLPARLRRGALQIAVASAGASPFVVRRLRQVLEGRLGPEWGEWVEAAARFRSGVRSLGLARQERERRFDQFFDATVDAERLRARVPTAAEEQRWLGGTGTGEQAPDAEQAQGGASGDATLPQHDRPWVDPPERTRVGRVALVGAGPGDPGLLTLRGRERLLEADAVVYDRLAATALPCDLPASVELHCVGKQEAQHPVPQEEINALLVRLAREGKRVVRLKGGDPYVFGRGGEEGQAVISAGLELEVVPCVTAGVAVPAYAGIPVTQRAEAVRVTFLTAHESAKESGPQVRWDLLASDPHATLVGYMGVTSLPAVVGRLVEAGMPRSTPAAMIERGTTSGQRVVRSTVAELPRAIEQAGLRPPGLFVIGRTVELADTLDWFSRRPLATERLGLVAPGGALSAELRAGGAEVVDVPLPVTPAARVVMGALPLTGWVFRDGDEVDAVDDERDGPGWGPEMVAWCLHGSAAERALRSGWRHVVEVQVGSGDEQEAAAGLAELVRRRRLDNGAKRAPGH